MPSRRAHRAWILAALLIVGLGAVGWAALAPLPATPRELVFVIPKGTAARRAAGQDPSVLPSRIRLTLGVQDVLVLRNEDEVEQTFGPALLAPGQTYRVPFRTAAEIPLVCSIHRDGQVTIVVDPAPSPGLARLWWRLSGLR